MLDDRSRVRRTARTVAVAAAAVVVLASCGNSEGPRNKQNALRPRGPYAHQILDLTRPFFWIAVVIGIAVVAATVYVALRFRVKPGEERAVKQTHGNTLLEVSWTIIPALILAVMAVPTVTTVFQLAKQPTGNVLHVTVTARQWWWEFHYDDNTNIETANELHIPTGVPVSLTLEGPPPCTGKGCYANGVIHSFWVPELNGKKDVVPGRKQFLKLKADAPGTFLGQCAEYCGLSHADMRLRVIAQTPADFQAWQQSQLNVKPEADLLKGVNNAQWSCSSCHSFAATKAGTIAPNLTKLADRDAFAGDIYKMNLDNLTRWIYDAPGRKPAGPLVKAGFWMPAFKDAGMTPADACAIAKFLLENTATNPQPPGDCPNI
jgi:cytochrome c oxidase subunit 2